MGEGLREPSSWRPGCLAPLKPCGCSEVTCWGGQSSATGTAQSLRAGGAGSAGRASWRQGLGMPQDGELSGPRAGPHAMWGSGGRVPSMSPSGPGAQPGLGPHPHHPGSSPSPLSAPSGPTCSGQGLGAAAPATGGGVQRPLCFTSTEGLQPRPHPACPHPASRPPCLSSFSRRSFAHERSGSQSRPPPPPAHI